MQRIFDKASEIEKKEREEMILAFISALLFFIPIAGQGVGAIGGVTLRALLSLISVAGGLAIYSVVQDPENTFMTVFSFLVSAGVGRGGFRSATGSRRGMGQKEFDSLGNVKTRFRVSEGGFVRSEGDGKGRSIHATR